jgi:hypothetical protein
MRIIIMFIKANNISDNKPISETIKRYLGPPGSIIEGKKIPSLTPKNPLADIPSNLISSDALRYVYDENEFIQCAVNPSNLVAPMKINDRLIHDNNSKSGALRPNGQNGPIDLARALRSMNPSFFDPNTHNQNRNSFIPDLLYHAEFDRVDSLHNAIVRPNSFVPPPIVHQPASAMTSQALNNINYYPVTDNFYKKDQFKCYSTTMSLIHQMNREKPAHLKQYDRRFINDDNILSSGNLLYRKNEDIDLKAPQVANSPGQKQFTSKSPATPGQKKYGIVIDKASSPHASPKMQYQVDERPMKQTRMNVLTKKAKKDEYQEIAYHGNNLIKLTVIDDPQSLMDVSPQSDTMSQPRFQDQNGPQYPEFENYSIELGNDEQCRKKLPNRQFDPNSPSSMEDSREESHQKDRASGKKRVMFDDQPRQGQINNVKRDLFNQSDAKYQSSAKQTSHYGSDSEPQTLSKYPKNETDYEHFHDESMSKLEAVLQRQRERLENLGGFSGKSSQVSHKSNGNQQNLEEAYQDLENEIYNIKQNLETSQNSEGYSPMKLRDSHALRSGMQDEMELSPSDLQYDEE